MQDDGRRSKKRNVYICESVDYRAEHYMKLVLSFSRQLYHGLLFYLHVLLHGTIGTVTTAVLTIATCCTKRHSV